MSGKNHRVMIVAGEASGDMYGSMLASTIKKLSPSSTLFGAGSRRMRQAGVDLLFDSSSWSAIGIAEALKVVPRVWASLRKLRAHIKASPPDLLILIDFGFFNIRLAKDLPDGVKVLYYIPPGSWHKNADYTRLKGIVDHVITPFPWSEELLKLQGFQANFFGHPLLDIAQPTFTRDEFCRQFGFCQDKHIIGLMPGSRSQELIHNLPAMIIAANLMSQTRSDLQFAIPLAASVDSNAIKHELEKNSWLKVDLFALEESNKNLIGSKGNLPISKIINQLLDDGGIEQNYPMLNIKLITGMSYDILAHSRTAVVASGTATMEAAILNCPMVIIYRGTRLTALEFKLLGKKVKFIGIPNILLDREAVPELIQEAASPQCIAELSLRLVDETPERQNMLSSLQEVRKALGKKGAVECAAKVAVEMLDPQKILKCNNA